MVSQKLIWLRVILIIQVKSYLLHLRILKLYSLVDRQIFEPTNMRGTALGCENIGLTELKYSSEPSNKQIKAKNNECYQEKQS